MDVMGVNFAAAAAAPRMQVPQPPPSLVDPWLTPLSQRKSVIVASMPAASTGTGTEDRFARRTSLATTHKPQPTNPSPQTPTHKPQSLTRFTNRDVCVQAARRLRTRGQAHQHGARRSQGAYSPSAPPAPPPHSSTHAHPLPPPTRR
jgi:hypothetical protein